MELLRCSEAKVPQVSKAGQVASYIEAVHYLPYAHAMDVVIAETDSGVEHFTQA